MTMNTIRKYTSKGRETAPETLYHVSPVSNRASIARSGIEPLFSKGRLAACWYVSRDRLEWAIAHCSARHKVDVSKLDVYALKTAKMKRIRANKHQGIFNSPCRAVPYARVSALASIEGDEHDNE